MKLRLTILTLLASTTIGFAQKAQNVYFFKNDGKQVTAKADADFIRIIQEPDSGETNFKLIEYYPNGKRKTLGQVKTFEPRLVLEGVIMNYDSLGRKTEMVTYNEGVKDGKNIYFFPNGKVRREAEYHYPTPTKDQMMGKGAFIDHSIFNTAVKIMYDADSSGNVECKRRERTFKNNKCCRRK